MGPTEIAIDECATAHLVILQISRTLPGRKEDALKKETSFSILLIIALAVNYTPTFAQADFWMRSVDAVQVWSLACSPDGRVFAGVQPGGLLISTDHGVSWSKSGLQYTDISSIAFNEPAIIIAATLGGPLYRSTDAGLSWAMPESTFYFYSAMVRALVSTTGGYVFAGVRRNISPCPCASGVYRSTDNGLHWLHTPITYATDHMTATPEGTLYADSDSLYRSTDHGNSWVNCSDGLPSLQINSLCVVSGTTLLAGTAQGLFCSTDAGDLWTLSALTNPPVNAIAVYRGAVVVAGTDSGVFISENAGATWKNEKSGLTQPRVLSLAIDSSGFIYAGTGDSGIYRGSKPITAIRGSSGQRPASCLLFQNYPNPFNPTTIVKYELPVQSFVSLGIFDLLGREVEEVLRERQDAGVHSIVVDASQLSSGVYFYRLQAGAYVQTKKLVVLR